MNKKIVYVAGPITGVTEYWKPFEAAEAELRSLGFTVLLPTRLPPEIDNGRAMKICLAMIDAADAVYFLPGFAGSEGATLEAIYCEYTGKPYEMSIEMLQEVLA